MDKDLMCSLVTKMQQGDPDAAGDLYLQSRDDLYYYIMKTVNDPELAEDLLQDSFMEIMESIGKLKEPAAFVVWSRQIAYHRCTAYFRKRHELLADENEEGQTVFDFVEEEREEFIPDAALEKEDLKATIGRMIDDLPPEQRNALLLRYFDELSVEDIAKIQNVPVGTVKSRLNYGRKMLKSAVETFEKKNNVKLHSVAILPLLLWFFREKALASGASLTAKGTAAVATAAVEGAKVAAGAQAVRTAAAAGAKQVAAEGAKQGAKAVATEGAKQATKAAAKGGVTRLIASVAATAVISSAGTAAVVHTVDKQNMENPAYVQVENQDIVGGTSVTETPETTQPDPLALPEPGSAWEGYGDSEGFARWFDMTLGSMSETAISGNLTLSHGATTYHTTGFSGTGTADGNKITYTITLSDPHLLSDLWDVTLESLDIVYDRQSRTFTTTGQYDVVLRNVAERMEQELPTGTWSGYGSDDAYGGLNEDHLFDLRVDKLSTVDISGHLTVSYQGLVDHDTNFTGRCRPRQSNGTYAYDIVLETTRTVDNIITITVDELTIIYDPADGSFAFAGIQFYEGTMEKN